MLLITFIVAAACAILRAVVTDAQSTRQGQLAVVSDLVELQEALHDGKTQYIHIVNHIDVLRGSELNVSINGNVNGGPSSGPEVQAHRLGATAGSDPAAEGRSGKQRMADASKIRSITADCSGRPLPATVTVEAVEAMLSRAVRDWVQSTGLCVVYSSNDILVTPNATELPYVGMLLWSSALADTAWLHNIAFIRAGLNALSFGERTLTDSKLLLTQLAVLPGRYQGLNLFYSNVGVSYGAGIDSSSQTEAHKYLIADSKFQIPGTYADGVTYSNGTIFLLNCAFNGTDPNRSAAVVTGAEAVVRRGEASDVASKPAAFKNCSFTRDTAALMSVKGVVYSEPDQSLVLLPEDSYSQTIFDAAEKRSLQDIPKGLFLEPDDAGVTRLRQEVHDVLGYELHSSPDFPATPPSDPRLIPALRPYRNDTSGSGTDQSGDAPRPAPNERNTGSRSSKKDAATPQAARNNAGGSSTGSNAGAIGGAVAAGVVVCALAVLCTTLLVKRRLRGRQSPPALHKPSGGPHLASERQNAIAQSDGEPRAPHEPAPLLVQSHTPAGSAPGGADSVSDRGIPMQGPGFTVNADLMQRQHPRAARVAVTLDGQAPVDAPLQRIVPLQTGTIASEGSMIMSSFTVQAPLLDGPGVTRDRLSAALMTVAAAKPPQLFAGRWQLQAEQKHGGQAVVQFARDPHGLQAIKFFLSREDFFREVKQYAEPTLKSVLPAMLHAHDNAEGTLSGPGSLPWPPFMVLERGMPMAEWAQQRRRTMEVWGLVEAMAALLAKLHEHDFVHRDLKPDNLLCLPSMQWRLLDMGIVAPSGQERLPSCTLPYAPPEVVLAVYEERRICVHPSHDIWSLGVLAYESLTQGRALKLQQQVLHSALGTLLYPWEVPLAQQHPTWRHSRLRPLIELCLARSSVQRPSAQALLAAVSRLGEDTSIAHGRA